jgi:hypothetical protein
MDELGFGGREEVSRFLGLGRHGFRGSLGTLVQRFAFGKYCWQNWLAMRTDLDYGKEINVKERMGRDEECKKLKVKSIGTPRLSKITDECWHMTYFQILFPTIHTLPRCMMECRFSWTNSHFWPFAS